MKIKIISLGVLFFAASYGYSQQYKPPIANEAFKNWPAVDAASISNDGQYVMYSINGIVRTGIIQSSVTNWTREGITGDFFTYDSKHVVYHQGDTLSVMKLGTDSTLIVSTKVSSFKHTGSGEWMAYQQENDKRLILLSFRSQKKLVFEDVKSFSFNEQENALLVETATTKNKSLIHSLICVSLPNGKAVTVWMEKDPTELSSVGTVAFNSTCDKLGFLLKTQQDSLTDHICYYDLGKKESKVFSSSLSSAMPAGYTLASDQKIVFDASGEKLFIKVKRNETATVNREPMAPVVVWNYKEERVQPDQDLKEKEVFLSVLMIKNSKFFLLEDPKDIDLAFSGSTRPPIGKYVLASQFNYRGEYWWPKDFFNRLFVISTVNGNRKEVLKDPGERILFPALSPDEKFVTWFSTRSRQYYSYEISSGITRDISSKVPYPLCEDSRPGPEGKLPYRALGWMKGDNGYLVYDQYDIWKLDPLGQKAPLNLTNGYGRKNGVVLGIASKEKDKVFSSSDPVLLSGFNRETKQNGICSWNPGGTNDLTNMNMGAYTCYISRTVNDITGIEGNWHGDIPVKARSAHSFIVKRMSAEESPNYFFTKDLKNFKKISDIHPEKEYNWLTAELINWKNPNGSYTKGILYKPENFDSHKKYPVIFYYYREKSDGFHSYLTPGLSWASINIPQYVSNGYLVFLPDISSKGHSPGKTALEAVLSAAKHISNFPGVDSTKMGLQGVSFGGFETNYIVTHTNYFAAACTVAGSSDIISSYGGLFGGDFPNQRLCEIGQFNIGSALWERPDLYMENSPVLNVDKVSTPLLIAHGDKDPQVPFEQGLEMFLNMRRAEKKVWLLQYRGEGHGMLGISAVDLDIRMRQFFDHYLKGATPPVWMTKGLPAMNSQKTNGLELDVTTEKP